MLEGKGKGGMCVGDRWMCWDVLEWGGGECKGGWESGIKSVVVAGGERERIR